MAGADRRPRPAPSGVVAVAAAVVLAAVAAWWLFVREDGRVVRAEFTSARGLVEGNDVRLGGAVAGTVDDIALTRRGRALVTLRLRDEAPPPRADAVLSVRPADLLGDTYVSYSPGRSRTALRGTVPTARTSGVARLDDLLRTFQPDVREGLGALLVEAGVALDDRGTDLGRLTIATRDTLAAADGTLAELDASRDSLRALVRDAEAAATPLGRRTDALGDGVTRFAQILDATAATAGGSGPTGAATSGGRSSAAGSALAAGLDGMPQTLRALRASTERLASTARAAQPLAARLRGLTPALATTLESASELVAEGRRAARGVTPAAGALRTLLADGAPTLSDAAGGLGALRTQAADIAELAKVIVPAAEPISQGFFEHFADQAAESGKQPFDPFADPRRAYWRGAAIFSCETFGVPVEPGCLDDVLGAPARKRVEPTRRQTPAPTPRPTRTPAPAAPAPTATPAPTTAAPTPTPNPVTQPVDDLLDLLLRP